MRFMIATAAALVLGSAAAYADSKPSDEEVTKIKEAVAVWGCEGGEYEKETEAYGVYEAEDVKCKAGQFDFRLNKDFKVFVITAD
jgi:hypothetical protein